MSIEKNNIYSNMLNTYKKDDLHMSTVKYEQVRKTFAKETEDMMIQVKIDGELCALVKDKRSARLYSRGGRIRSNTPLTKEAEHIAGEFVIIGELYVVSPTGGPQTYAESMSTLRKPESLEDEERFRFSAFDVVEMNNAPYVENYIERFKELKEFMGNIKFNTKHIHLAPYAIGGIQTIMNVWKEFVEHGWEGLVVHANSGIYKIKKFFPIDLAVVGVTRNTGYETHIGAIQTAFMTDNNTFILSSKVGTGLTHEARKEWLEWATDNEVEGPGDEIIWVDPTKHPRVIEVRVEEYRGKEESVMKFDGHQFVEAGKDQTVTLRKPVFVRIREDKEFEPVELGFDQVPVWDKEKGKVVTASFPEHPDTVIFDTNEYYSREINEKDVYNYYAGVADKIVKELGEDSVMTITRTDTGDIIRKHAPAGGAIKATTKEDFDKLNNGRMIEVHRILGKEEPFMLIDIDPRKSVPFADTKSLTLDLCDFIEAEFPEVRGIKIYFSGNHGFHLYFMLPEPGPVNRFHEMLKEKLMQFIEDNKEYKLSLSHTEDDAYTRLDISIFHEGGSIRVPYSLHKATGLVAIPVDIDKLEDFIPSMAQLNKLTKVGFVIIEMPEQKQAIAFDFDHTIYMGDMHDWYSGTINEDLVPLIQAVKESGKLVVILTARIYDHPEDIDFIADILDEAGIPWDEITYEKKPYITDFVDDRAINVNDFSEVMGVECPKTTVDIGIFGGIDTIWAGALTSKVLKMALKTTGKPPAGVSPAQFPRDTKNFLRYRQFSPSLCTKGSFSMKKLPNGDKLVLCKRKDTGKTGVQSKMVKKKKGK